MKLLTLQENIRNQITLIIVKNLFFINRFLQETLLSFEKFTI